ncbi:carbon-nitrogen hydrolase family protein [Crateriforma spongiae]|uniref:carbon-nitrogen hydrolase family protein n=1 Tax=Crateriforma spongiae TaxID=2724528 RepID=UPI001446BBE8|nr:carbon-nitrogen hydrolase family protein [Crateriforma spongiae]
MPSIRIALANVQPARHADHALEIVLETMVAAATGGASIVCFPECFLPGYRTEPSVSRPSETWLDQAWAVVDDKAADLQIGVILGTERVAEDGRMITARVTNPDGTCAGFQDKVQLDPSEEAVYTKGRNRKIFHCGPLLFGIVICHEGWRYPETVRWAARHGAHVVFHPHFEIVESTDYLPSRFADPANSFHEKAALCRAAENTCYFATVNCALRGATTTSAVVDPDGVLMTHQPYGKSGVLFAGIHTEKATGLLAKRFRSIDIDDQDATLKRR